MRSFLGGLLVAVVLVIGVALYFNWMDVSVDRTPDSGRSNVTINVDERQARDDLRHAGEEISDAFKEARDEIRERVSEAKGEQTVKGTLQSVDLTKNVVTVKPDGGTAMAVELTDATAIKVGDKAGSREDLKAGQKVTCVHSTRDGKHVCKSLTVELNR